MTMHIYKQAVCIASSNEEVTHLYFLAVSCNVVVRNVASESAYNVKMWISKQGNN